jgi:hypothetical protein
MALPAGERRSQWIKFADHQDRDLREAVRYKGQTIQSYCLTAIMRDVEETLAEKHADKERRTRGRPPRRPPVGLGIDLGQLAAPSPSPREVEPPPPQVVIHNGPAAVGGADAGIMILARAVVNGPALMRNQRLEQARQTIRDGAETGDEMRLAIRALENAVAALEERAHEGPSRLEWLKSAKR